MNCFLFLVTISGWRNRKQLMVHQTLTNSSCVSHHHFDCDFLRKNEVNFRREKLIVFPPEQSVSCMNARIRHANISQTNNSTAMAFIRVNLNTAIRQTGSILKLISKSVSITC